MKLNEYVSWLIEVNVWFAESRGTKLNSKLSTSTFGFGLIEEIGELQEVINTDKAIYEAGDVIAYVVLLLYSMDVSEELITLMLEDTSEATLLNCHDVSLDVAPLAGELKRYFRGDDNVDMDLICSKCFNIIDYCYFIVGHGLETIVQLNQLKLEKRLSNVGTFIGRGDR
jgi:NTP pyrophosphatase (non-canonical NTP hydrolase)